MLMARPEWQEHFQGCMTRISFKLLLSRPMMEMLCATSDDVYWDRARYGGMFEPDNFLGTERALVNRGLIVRKLRLKNKEDIGRPPYELTPAGLAVVELLKVGGLFLEAEEANKRMKKRKGRN